MFASNWKTQFSRQDERLSVVWKLGMALLAVSLSPPVQDACRNGVVEAQCGTTQWLVTGALLLSAGFGLFASWCFTKAGTSARPSTEFKVATRNAATILAAYTFLFYLGRTVLGYGSSSASKFILAAVVVVAIVVDIRTRD